jgi:hypothetical protein
VSTETGQHQLKKEDLLLNKVSNDVLLESLSKWDENDPIIINDKDIISLRDTFESVPGEEGERLGHLVGARIQVRGYRYEKGKKVNEYVAPSRAYRPASIEKRKYGGWSVAAGKTPGIYWIHGDYEEVLRSHRRSRGASAFFGILGAEVAPRLVDNQEFGGPSTIIRAEIPAVQLEDLDRLKGRTSPTHFRNDKLAPELTAVVRSIAKESVSTERRRRAKALVKTLEAGWDRLYKDYTEAGAVHFYYTWRFSGRVTSTWLALTKNEIWLSNRRGRKKAPRELTVRTPGNLDVYGEDSTLFAYELDPEDARHPLILALGIEGDPHASGIVRELNALRDDCLSGRKWDKSQPQKLYSALSAHCSGSTNGDSEVDDMTVRQLRNKFGLNQDNPGLIYTRGRWLSIRNVFLEPAIFGSYRAFVPHAPRTELLWRTLWIGIPEPADCLDVLEELTSKSLDDDDASVLLDTYRFLDDLMEKDLPRRLQRRLSDLPLWSGAEWLKERPVYVVASERVADGLSQHVPVWRPPCSFPAFPRLVRALGITYLQADIFAPVGIHADAVVVGNRLGTRFSAAVEHLRTYLAQHDDKIARRFTRWRELQNASIFVSPELSVEIPIGADRYQVSTNAHISQEPLTIYVTSEDGLGDADIGGRLISSMFTLQEAGRFTVSLAWEKSWRRAGLEGAPGRSVHLAEAKPEGDSAELTGGNGQPSKRSREKTSRRDPRKGTSHTTTTDTRPDFRELKTLEEANPVSVSMVKAGSRAGGAREVSRREMKTAKEAVNSSTVPDRASTSKPKAFTPEQREDLGYEVMRMEVRSRFGTELTDCRRQQSVGADAIDSSGTYFELKAHEGEMPDIETLSANEAEKALELCDNYYLVVVSGLEKGYDTNVVFVCDPINTLDFRYDKGIELAGIKKVSLPSSKV